MSDVAIAVENLSKSYLIGHQASQREPYTALRDVIAREARNFARKGLDFVRGRQIVQGDDVEQFWALRDVSFKVRRGEVLGIIGRNGAGKSTLLKLLSRITEPDEGRATLKGRVASLLEVGTGFHPELTGRENIFLNGAVLGMSKAEIRSKFDEIVAFSEVEQFIDTPMKRYSSGMAVRLGFAVAAHLEPEILIVDEVLAVGDNDFQKKCLAKMRSVSKEGRTILFVSHQLGSLAELCDSGLVLKKGRMVQCGDIETAIKTYLESLVAQQDFEQNSSHIARVRFEGGPNRKKHIFFGEPLVVRVKLRNLPPHPIGFTITIRNHAGRRVSFFSTDPHDGVPLPRKREVNLSFQVYSCLYAPGNYHIDVAVTEPRIRIMEELFGVLQLEILEAPRGGTEPYSAVYAEYFPPHSWEIT
jgi:ABC-type polysaccharide/polyol phosphate transport system ATPase subunit